MVLGTNSSTAQVCSPDPTDRLLHPDRPPKNRTRLFEPATDMEGTRPAPRVDFVPQLLTDRARGRCGVTGATRGREPWAVNGRQHSRRARRPRLPGRASAKHTEEQAGRQPCPGKGALPRGAARPPPPLSPQEITEGAAKQSGPADVTAALPPQRKLLGGTAPSGGHTQSPHVSECDWRPLRPILPQTSHGGHAPFLRWSDDLSISWYLPAPFRRGKC